MVYSLRNGAEAHYGCSGWQRARTGILFLFHLIRHRFFKISLSLDRPIFKCSCPAFIATVTLNSQRDMFRLVCPWMAKNTLSSLLTVRRVSSNSLLNLSSAVTRTRYVFVSRKRLLSFECLF